MPDHSAEYRAYKLLQKIIVCCAGAIVLAIFMMFLYASDKSQGRCEELQGIRTYILEATNRGIASLPTIDYYKTHPAERARALENLQRQREEFATPLDCSFL